MKILCLKITTIDRLIQIQILCVLKFGTWYKFDNLEQSQKVWHYWLQNKMKSVLRKPQVNERLIEFKKNCYDDT